VGGGNAAVQEAIYLESLGCHVTIIHRRDQLRAEKYCRKVKRKENPGNLEFSGGRDKG
jgi:thioredoxin reductase (NADPH)